MKTAISLLAAITAFALPAATQTADAAKTQVAVLTYFLGHWECAGKFDASGKPIEAELGFESILDSHFVLFRHDDKPPHKYHAWAEWGWDSDNKRFVATVQDSFAGTTRLFYTSGWDGARLVWEGGAVGKDADQQFVFERCRRSSFK